MPISFILSLSRSLCVHFEYSHISIISFTGEITIWQRENSQTCQKSLHTRAKFRNSLQLLPPINHPTAHWFTNHHHYHFCGATNYPSRRIRESFVNVIIVVSYLQFMCVGWRFVLFGFVLFLHCGGVVVCCYCHWCRCCCLYVTKLCFLFSSKNFHFIVFVLLFLLIIICNVRLCAFGCKWRSTVGEFVRIKGCWNLNSVFVHWKKLVSN